ncbi:MAG: cupin domain-containing protein [Chloroflexi bacterium]|nr:cupin domain-containing protein [Chloroflexota bacterium]
MEQVHRDPSQARRSDNPLFDGEVRQQPLNTNPQFRISEVTFVDGGKTKWHTHTFNQVLVITDGEGIVATEGDERHVGAGDVLYIEPGTRHWHGAAPDKTMSHLSINGPGDTSY